MKMGNLTGNAGTKAIKDTENAGDGAKEGRKMNEEKSVAEKIIDGLEQFANDLKNRKPIKVRTMTHEGWSETLELTRIYKNSEKKRK